MRSKSWWKYVALSWAIAGVSACSNGRDTQTGNDQERSRGRDVETPITVAGCLQKGGARSYVLTRVNQPSDSVGTSGASDSSVVRREQMRAAAGSYRIDPADNMALDALVGHEVRVTGTVTENADLPRPSDQSGSRGSSPEEIEQSDLTRVRAASVESVRDVCQGAESAAPGTPAERTTDTPRR
jgi:hypothetical protein